MAFVKKTWKDRIAEFPTRRRLTKEDNTSELVTVAREEGTLSQEGDAFSAENMNDLENRIDAEFTAVNGKLDKRSYTAETLSATTFTIVRKKTQDLIIIAVDNEGGEKTANNYFIVIGDTVKSIAGGWAGITCTLNGHVITLKVTAYCAVGILSTNEIAVSQ